MYEKFAASLAETGAFEVHIVGYRGHKEGLDKQGIFLHPLFQSSRMSAGRFLAPFKYFKFLLKLRPEAIIVNSPDLLAVTALYKIVCGAEMYYDIRENYALNALYSGGFRRLSGWLVGRLVRLVEWAVSPLVKHFFLAELAYAKQLPFLGKRYSVLLNWAAQLPPDLPPSTLGWPSGINGVRLLYSGNISLNYGVANTIEHAISLNAKTNSLVLMIAGRYHDPALANRILLAQTKHSFICTAISRHNVAHSDILSLAQQADALIAPYHKQPSFQGKIPTKCFEAAALRKPILLPRWLLNDLVNTFSGSPFAVQVLANTNYTLAADSANDMNLAPVLISNSSLASFFWAPNSNANLVLLLL